MSDVQRIEFYSMENCGPCKQALHDIMPVVNKHNIPIEMKNDKIIGVLYPMVCIIKKINGIEEMLE